MTDADAGSSGPAVKPCRGRLRRIITWILPAAEGLLDWRIQAIDNFPQVVKISHM
jgi:hypothetical protein